MFNLLIFIGLIALCTISNEKKIDLNDKNFDKIVKKGDTLLLWFYAEYCGHCQKAKPAVQKAVNELMGIADIAYIQCDSDQNKEICARYNIRGFPTFKLVHSKYEKKDVMNTARVFPTVEYQGNREADSLINFIMYHLKPSFEQFDSLQQIAANISVVQKEQNAVLIVSSKKNPTTLMYKLSKKYTEGKYLKNKFFVVTNASEDAVNQYSSLLPENMKEIANDYHGFKLIVKEGDNFNTYKGENNKKSIDSWLSSNIYSEN